MTATGRCFGKCRMRLMRELISTDSHRYTPTIGRNGTILKTGTASTVNPAVFIHTKVSPPDYQSVQIVTDGFATSEDKDMKVIK